MLLACVVPLAASACRTGEHAQNAGTSDARAEQLAADAHDAPQPPIDPVDSGGAGGGGVGTPTGGAASGSGGQAGTSVITSRSGGAGGRRTAAPDAMSSREAGVDAPSGGAGGGSGGRTTARGGSAGAVVDVAASSGGAGGGGGASDSPSGGLRRAPLVEYVINESVSGQGPRALSDAQPNPVDLVLTYVDKTPSFTKGTVGTGLNFPLGDVRYAGAFSEKLDEGNKVYDQLNGARTATLEVLAEVDWANNPAYIFQIFGVEQDDGELDDFSLWRWDNRLEASLTGPKGYQTSYYKRSMDISLVTQGPHLFHVVFDTTDPTPSRRLRFYMDGVLQPQIAPNEGGQEIPRNETLSIPPPNQSRGLTGPLHSQMVSLGCMVDYYAGTGGFRGTIYYAAIHTNALNDDEIAAAGDRIKARKR